ncbi:TetR/AcrR family transcriptional regulator [Paenibacillus barengoltzii]|uniref:TetR/AcrR family transcriptional regulator n=1 Tax=Paenibacillus barengoltzii TaxID=343517 RepID=UPI002DBBDFE8|nr:TetR/AcrR family transcriptional regulator [Paenibacillus barengoltzii]MEC2343861.1 TetR/AcrR family transcriptional regulator [Paenibacillus barengoltzii]
MSPREDQQSRKQHILEAAAVLFAERGYYKTTTADVARVVGVTQPYVFHFFKSKEELYLAVLEQASKQIYYAFESVEARPEELKESLGLAFAKLLETHRNEILLVMMSYTIPEPAVREFTRQCFDVVYDRLKARFEQAGFPNPGNEASAFIGTGLVISLSESVGLSKLLPWC